jgi:hypothetical protein
VTYAATTTVAPEKSRAEIERALARYGCTGFMYMSGETRAVIMFETKDRRLRFDLPLPKNDGQRKTEQVIRSRWRGLLLCIKAKLESVESHIESFDEAFLAHVVMPDGGTVYQHTQERISAVYAGGEMRPLLPAPSEVGNA